LWLIRDYLLELGGREKKPSLIEGPGWSASLVSLKDFQIGSLRVARVQLRLEAEAEVFQNIRPALEKNLLRAGG
jgi:hypothetical protein